MKILPIITLIRFHHRKQNRIGLKFKYDDYLISKVRKLPNATWSQSKKMWYLNDTIENYKLISTSLQGDAKIDANNYLQSNKIISKPEKSKRILTQEQKDLLNGFYKYLKGKRYSISTINTYVHFSADFVEFCKNKALNTITNRDVELFIETVFIKRNYSISTQRQFISALKLFIRFEPSTKINELELTRPNRNKKLPIVLSQLDIIKLISYTKNLKHRIIIALLYGSGLRISELINLKISDIDIKRRQVFINNGKGRKDRYSTIAESFLPLLNNYFLTYKPQYYFVEGPKNEKYSASSVRKFLHKYVKQSGIKSNVTPHTLRHSYATHLLENGVSLRHIQSLLGHSKPETTMIYTHVARKDLLAIKSPLDNALDELKKLDKQEQNFLLSGK